MGMEFLSMRYIDEFFNNELSEKYKRNRWKDAVEMVSTETLEVLDYDIFDQPIVVQFYNELTKLDQR